MKYILLIFLFSTLCLHSAPKIYNQLGVELKEMSDSCKEYEREGFSSEKLKKECASYVKKVDETLKFGYAIENSPKRKDTKKYLRLLRGHNKQYKLLLFMSGAKKRESFTGQNNKILKEITMYGVKLSDSQKLSILTNYLIKQSLEKKPIYPKKPKQPSLPDAKKLKKFKYEKISDFNIRIELERENRAKKIEQIKEDYSKNVRAYNKKVKLLTANYNGKISKQQKNMESITISSIKKAYTTVYGKPYLDSNLKYDTENERFYGYIKSTKGDFKEQVAINVPINRAEEFEKNASVFKTKVFFKYKAGKLTLKKIVMEKGNKSIIAMLNSVNFKNEDVNVVINEGSLNLNSMPLLSSSLTINETDYNIAEVNYSKDPEIAKLQKRKFELEKRASDKKQSLDRENELREQKLALEAQIALLQDTKGGVNDIPKLLKNAKSHKVDATKWLFIVGIENYEYTDPVAYSSSSAKEFKNVMKKRLGIPKSNIRTLINRGATSSKISYQLNDMLRRVKRGDTIYFYYSGHGIPVPSQNNAPYMLAQDMNPSYLVDERFKLQTIYKELSNSKASKVIAFIDSCFSGGTDNQALIKGVAATRVKPKRVSFDNSKMIVISAGSGTQYSNKYDEKSNRLFSYYVMRGLINNNTDTQRLYDYVKSNVQEKSYEMGASYEQVPVYDGNIKLKL